MNLHDSNFARVRPRLNPRLTFSTPIGEIWSFHGAGDGTPMSGGHHIDLWKANQWLLEQAGIHKENIQLVGIDTFTTGEFFSARREGIKCGRIINAIKLIPQ